MQLGVHADIATVQYYLGVAEEEGVGREFAWAKIVPRLNRIRLRHCHILKAPEKKILKKIKTRLAF